MHRTVAEERSTGAGRRPWFILLVTLGGVVLCAVPFIGGLAGIIAGIAAITLNRRDKEWAQLHTGDFPLRQIGELATGQWVRLRGRVISKATVTAPVSKRAVVFAAVTGTSTSSYEPGDNQRKLPPRCFGDSVEIEDSSGRAEITLRNVHILSRHVHRHDEHNQGQLSALRDGCYRVPAGWYLDVEEMTIDPDDELCVAGRIEAVEDIAEDCSGEHRDGVAMKRVRIGSQAGGDIRVTNLTADELQRMLAMSPGFKAMGVVWLVAAAGCLVFWGWRFLS